MIILKMIVNKSKRRKNNRKFRIFLNLFLVSIFLLLIPYINAESSFTFKSNQYNDLKIPCLNSDNSPCMNTVDCYLTVNNPNGTEVVEDGIMQYNSGGKYNYTLQPFYAQGEYSAYMRCDNGADYGGTTFIFEITPTGNNLETSQSIISFVSVGIMVFFSIIFLVLTIAFKHPGTKIFFLGLSLTTMVFTAGYILQIMNETIGVYMSFTDIFSAFYSLLTILLTGASISLILYLIVFAIKQFYSIRGYYD